MIVIKASTEFQKAANEVRFDCTRMVRLTNRRGDSRAWVLPTPVPDKVEHLIEMFYSEVLDSIRNWAATASLAIDFRQPRWGPKTIRLESEGSANVQENEVIVNVILPRQNNSGPAEITPSPIVEGGDGSRVPIGSGVSVASHQKPVYACVSRKTITPPLKDITKTAQGRAGDVVILEYGGERLYAGTGEPGENGAEIYLLTFVYGC
ncbi:hypothetical protein TOPH_03824 [Tolypocladium ophioglossoides CBS 100239]|uniref:Uncharacterized protein n=1 Tax=Tolypocladium ophioglossoides (strain CBS 100239) TaxID=1163406 RepID=A0A0L0NBR3_TOLOC|nr:hypothetical protein TOPH_03824 [Tolypocladium ophioglossoides CBS 100239]